MLKIHQITDEAGWLDLKKNYVSSTESSALFGLSPYATAFELYHVKRGNISGEVKDTNFLKFGRLIEAPVVEMVKIEKPDWFISPMRVFAYDDADKMGSSFDRVVNIPGNGIGLMEIKSISDKQFKKDFIGEGDDIEAAPHYEVQIQHQLEVIDKYDFCVLVVFILDTRQLVYVHRKRDKEVGLALREAVKKFWAMEQPPEPDFALDKSVIAKVSPAADVNKTIDGTQNARLTELAAMYKAEKELEAQSKNNAEKFYAEIMTIIGDARYAWTNHHKITASDTKPSAGRQITQDMVGEFINARAGYKKLTITALKKED